MLIVQMLHVRVHEMPCQREQFKHLHNSLKACDSKLPQVADWCCDETHLGFFAKSAITKQEQLHHPPRPLDTGHHWIIHIIFIGGGVVLLFGSFFFVSYNLSFILNKWIHIVRSIVFLCSVCFAPLNYFCSCALLLVCSLQCTKHTIQGK